MQVARLLPRLLLLLLLLLPVNLANRLLLRRHLPVALPSGRYNHNHRQQQPSRVPLAYAGSRYVSAGRRPMSRTLACTLTSGNLSALSIS